MQSATLFFTNWPYEHRGSTLDRQACESKYDRCQTCDTPLAVVRTTCNDVLAESKTSASDWLLRFCFCLPQVLIPVRIKPRKRTSSVAKAPSLRTIKLSFIRRAQLAIVLLVSPLEPSRPVLIAIDKPPTVSASTNYAETFAFFGARNGIPNISKSLNASSSVLAVVTMQMFIPCVRVYLSAFNSGNTKCSDKPRL